ncbi:uncharacterized protein A1O9_02040 [Exophiala aquamarina CBS 119918]|uniref:Uncharacterized protein n=1 Tax=Exophiala aquamarina CBS 119918 TaxID=1182545 RepID=A0A072PK46_9EURO|nr:uncharacterized protein A1O9_02040 [Exophiala aquamarina CBS 119918]KEF60479.1 hypothetical protein A1O9_02040 [Exophiala aquamarina CBS 119918]
MAIQSSGSDDAVLVKVDPGAKTTASTGSASNADFALSAHGEHWENFLAAAPVAPYTSFIGLQGMNIKQVWVGVNGNEVKFAQYGHLATRLLELLREGQNGPLKEDPQPEIDEDHISGKYKYIDCPVWGAPRSSMSNLVMDSKRSSSCTQLVVTAVNTTAS